MTIKIFQVGILALAATGYCLYLYTGGINALLELGGFNLYWMLREPETALFSYFGFIFIPLFCGWHGYRMFKNYLTNQLVLPNIENKSLKFLALMLYLYTALALVTVPVVVAYILIIEKI